MCARKTFPMSLHHQHHPELVKKGYLNSCVLLMPKLDPTICVLQQKSQLIIKSSAVHFIIVSGSYSRLTQVEPDVDSCCCSIHTSRFDMLCALTINAFFFLVFSIFYSLTYFPLLLSILLYPVCRVMEMHRICHICNKYLNNHDFFYPQNQSGLWHWQEQSGRADAHWIVLQPFVWYTLCFCHMLVNCMNEVLLIGYTALCTVYRVTGTWNLSEEP